MMGYSISDILSRFAGEFRLSSETALRLCSA